MDEVQGELKKKCRGLTKKALHSIFTYQWPGNVREFRNVIRQAVLLCDENDYIRPDHLALNSDTMPAAEGTDLSDTHEIYDGNRSLKETVKSFTYELEKRIIEETIAAANGNKSEAARRLMIDYKTLLRKIKTYPVK